MKPTLRLLIAPALALPSVLSAAVLFSDDFSNPATLGSYYQSITPASLIGGGTMNIGTSTNRSVFAYFPSTTLAVGESISFSFDFKSTAWASSSGGFRFGLFNSNGTAVTDGLNSEYGPFTGYMVQANSTPVSGNSVSFRDRTAGGGTTLITSNNGAIYSLIGAGSNISPTPQNLAANTLYIATITVTRTGATETTLFTSVTGGSLSSVSHSVIDSGTIVSAFDGLAVHGTSAVLGGSGQTLTLDNFSVTYTPLAIPEPSAYAAFAGIAALSLVAGRRRHARA